MLPDDNLTTFEIQSWFIPLDIFNTVCCTLAALLALIFLFIILYDKLYTTVTMIFVANSCIAELGLSLSLSGTAVYRMYRDVHQIYYEDLLCTTLSCIIYIAIGLQNYFYLLQSFYRYVLVVYPNRVFYQSIKFQTSLLFVSWIISIVYPIILSATGQLKYNPDDQICQMPLGFSVMLLVNSFYIFTLPTIGLMIVYMKMVRYVKDISRNLATSNSLFHARRELTMIRRIITLVLMLSSLGVPYFVFMVMSFFNRAPKYSFRISYSFISPALIPILLSVLQMAEPLKNSLKKRIMGHRTNVVRTIS